MRAAGIRIIAIAVTIVGVLMPVTATASTDAGAAGGVDAGPHVVR